MWLEMIFVFLRVSSIHTMEYRNFCLKPIKSNENSKLQCQTIAVCVFLLTKQWLKKWNGCGESYS